MLIQGIRFALKRKLCRYIVVPKLHSQVKCSDAPPIAVRSKKVKEYWKFDCTHRCTFQQFRFNLSETLRRLVNRNKMESKVCQSYIKPPECVKGMTHLDKSKFSKIVTVPSVIVPIVELKFVTKRLKHHQLKISHVKPVVELTECDPRFSTHRRYLLDPEKVKNYDTVLKMDMSSNLTFTEKDFEMVEVDLNYENWSFQEVMLAIMPDDMDAVAGFSQVGHIAHFNLRKQALPFKTIIGQVLLDKLACVKTVVNKLDTIDSTYRTFQMELLAGEDNFVTQTKENGLTFELDFSKVYWNSRLGSEHGRMTERLSSNDIVFDVFAGIGPFAVPAVKRKAQVFANDLNPSSYESLVKNVKLNKCDSSRIKCYNMDGREFINSVMKNELTMIYSLPEWNTGSSSEVETKDCKENCDKKINSISVLMNLPALAYTFLDAFKGLLCDLKTLNSTIPLTTVHCYCFTNAAEADDKFDGDLDKELRHRTINIVGCLEETDITVRFVRDVAPKKLMKCVSFELTEKLLCSPDNEECSKQILRAENDEPPSKCRKLEGTL